MQGNAKIIDAMNAGLTIELTAINQYFIHAKMCRNWGFNKLADHFYHESIEEMKHAEWLIDRILFLDGTPEIARYDVIRVGQDVRQQIENSLALELNAVKTYNQGIRLANDENDAGSREVMDKILVQSEESVDWAEAQLHRIDKVGIENYLAAQMGETSEG
ncbi:MAG TPA: bacterioferritin [Planctomycetaceae bacterium]|nr:bacterioferritin [Planctomycetaceae bacterium]